MKKAKDRWFKHVAKQAESRVFDIAALYGEDTEAFEEAYRGKPALVPNMDRDAIALSLMEFCCKVVAPEWTWTVTVDGEDVEVQVKEIR